MSTYVIGDIQGCYQSFRKLLNKIKFKPSRDHLYLAGDLINRGPESLETMKFILAHKSSIDCVLGNHDLHFLAVAQHCQPASPKDTFDDILKSPERDRIVAWLSQQPLLRQLPSFKTLIVHAGLPNFWSASEALKLSAEVSSTLRTAMRYQFFVDMYGNEPAIWTSSLRGTSRLRFITNVFTRMRYCYQDGQLELTIKCPLGQQPKSLIPWFEITKGRFNGQVVFGHWAALNGSVANTRFQAIDTGCVWGGKLTALRLEDQQRISVKSVEKI
jgi:bis(5'-nucleosyl)-tetraphosphatase (symmetrical)